MTTTLRACALDLRILRRTHLLYGTLTLAAFALAAVTGASYLPLFMAGFWVTSGIAGFFTLRDRDRLDILAASLGVDRHAMVASRYLVVAAHLIVVALAFVTLTATRAASSSAEGAQMAAMGVGFTLMLALYASVQLGVSFCVPGPRAMFVSMLVLMGLVFLPLVWLGWAEDPSTSFMRWLGSVNGLTLTIAALAVVAYALSWLVTRRIVAGRDL